jgi:protoheme IX farnesyltransferase
LKPFADTASAEAITAPATARAPGVASAGDYLTLMKPRIMQLVVFTAAAGLLAAPGTLHPVMAFTVLLAVALGSGAAGAINMWYDADIDAVMRRTSDRPIPAGRIPREEALSLGLIMAGVSVILLWLASNAVAAALLALSIAYYGGLYTIGLKRHTPQNIVIGGAAGAFPPVIGWAAVTGATPLDAWILFAIIFLWTPPHFWALSLLASKEYARAGVPMLPVTHGARATRVQILAYTLALFACSLLPVLTGLGGVIYLATAIILGLGFSVMALRLLRSSAGEESASPADRKAALGLFGFSIAYLFILFGAVMVEQAFGWLVPVMTPLLPGGAA